MNRAAESPLPVPERSPVNFHKNTPALDGRVLFVYLGRVFTFRIGP